MKYKVHHFEIRMNEDQLKLDQFLNSLQGEIASIVPNVKPIFRPMKATAKVDFLLIIEKTAELIFKLTPKYLPII